MKYLAAVVATFALASCASTPSAAPAATDPPTTTIAPTTTTAAPTTTAATTTVPLTRPTLPITTEPPMNGYQPDVYLDAVKEFTPYWYYSYEDDVLLNLAHLSCQNLDEGMSIERLLFDLMDMVYSVDATLNDSIGAWLRSVVRYICPEHFSQIG